jgi:uncharacterized repeat protein (TIGR01451 family)
MKIHHYKTERSELLMRKTKGTLFLPLLMTLILIAMMATPVIGAAAQPTVNLGTTSTFAVLAGSTITNTGTTTINGDAGGDVGLFPGTVFTGLTDVTLSGTSHLADTVANTAKTDLTTAYNDAAGRLPVTRIPTELGGTTLTPGVYDSADGTFQITGTLTLDAQGDPDGVFIFKSASTLITADSSKVVLTNSARYCRTFWTVGSSATLGTNSQFVGHIFAMTSITAKTGASIQGQLLAMNGAVTLDSNIINNGLCSAPAPGLFINLTKTPSALELTNGPGPVTYTYNVTNPGDVALGNISVTDDKISTVTYVSGDANSDQMLQKTETWVYTSMMNLVEKTTNTATVTGSANNVVVSDTAVATVNVVTMVVVTPPVPSTTAPTTTAPVITETVTGGEIPDTATPWYNLLLAGAALILIGVAGKKIR